jgi:putative acetyltransferase
MFELTDAATDEDLTIIRYLFREYAATLGFDLCFQDFNAELAGLPGDYAPPRGRLILARCSAEPAGCIALRPLADDICEMKRLYVRPHYRAHHLGRLLSESIIVTAREAGYRAMRLDTVPGMLKAITLYRSLGFREIPPYRHNPIEGALFFELDLQR